MQSTIRTLIVAVSVLGGASQAEAQALPKSYSYVLAQPTELNGPTNVPSVAGGSYIARPTVGATYIPPYSYHVVANPYATRYYSGYGTNDFPYYGQPYGRPYDAWTWPYLSHGYYNGMARYYQEVVPPSIAPGFVTTASNRAIVVPMPPATAR